MDVSFIKEFWLPDAEILNLKEFETLNVLSKLEGLWLNRNFEIMYAVATRITFICPMTFNSFPLDVQVCLFQVSFAVCVLRRYYITSALLLSLDSKMSLLMIANDKLRSVRYPI